MKHPKSTELAYAIKVAQEPWTVSNRTVRACVKVLERCGYKSMAEGLRVFERDNVPFENRG